MIENSKYIRFSRFQIAKKIYEKCIDLFSNHMELLFKSELKYSFKKGGPKKFDGKVAKSVKLLLITIMNLAILYEKEQRATDVWEVVIFGIWFGKSKKI